MIMNPRKTSCVIPAQCILTVSTTLLTEQLFYGKFSCGKSYLLVCTRHFAIFSTATARVQKLACYLFNKFT